MGLINFVLFFGNFVGSILEREYSITNSLFKFLIFSNNCHNHIQYAMNGSLKFSISYLYYQKNWLNILIDDPLLNNITKLEPKK